ncbi:MAG: alpha-ketoglutarate-dependent dioxygenase AlkB, partial [Mucilaginibacter sp.]
MEQLAFFAEAGQSKDLPEHLLEYRPGLISTADSDELLAHFIATTPWQQTKQKMWDKEYLTPRLTCWYGETDRIAGTL